MKRTKRQLADVYRRAAKLIDKQGKRSSCFAIAAIAGGSIFNGYESTLYRIVTDIPWVPWDFGKTDHQQVRVLNLLLMSEWVLTDWDGEML